MNYFIHYVKQYAAGNKKCRELNDYIGQYAATLVYGDLSLDALKREVAAKIAELNAKYPKTKPLIFDPTTGHWESRPKDNPNETVFVLQYSMVKKTYRFAEEINMPQVFNFLTPESHE